jgi:hypothetical protein
MYEQWRNGDERLADMRGLRDRGEKKTERRIKNREK